MFSRLTDVLETMDRRQLLALSLLLFLCVCVCGCAVLVYFERVIPPGF